MTVTFKVCAVTVAGGLQAPRAACLLALQCCAVCGAHARLLLALRSSDCRRPFVAQESFWALLCTQRSRCTFGLTTKHTMSSSTPPRRMCREQVRSFARLVGMLFSGPCRLHSSHLESLIAVLLPLPAPTIVKDHERITRRSREQFANDTYKEQAREARKKVIDQVGRSAAHREHWFDWHATRDQPSLVGKPGPHQTPLADCTHVG